MVSPKLLHLLTLACLTDTGPHGIIPNVPAHLRRKILPEFAQLIGLPHPLSGLVTFKILYFLGLFLKIFQNLFLPFDLLVTDLGHVFLFFEGGGGGWLLRGEFRHFHRSFISLFTTLSDVQG